MNKMIASEKTKDMEVVMDSSDGDEPRNLDEILHVDAQTRVEGMCYSVTVEEAKELGWSIIGAPTVGRSGKYVVIDEMAPNQHEFLSVPKLGPDFYSKGALVCKNIDRFLARAQPDPVNFAIDWMDKGWARNEDLWGNLGKRFTAEIKKLMLQPDPGC